MEWYYGDKILTRFPLQERWKQLTDSHSPYKFSNGATDEPGFSYQSSIHNLGMERVTSSQSDHHAEISYAQVEGASDESSLYWNTLLNNVDYQPNGLPWTNLTDESFMNSLLADDVRFNQHFHLYNAPSNLANDVLLDSSAVLYNMHHMNRYDNLSYHCSEMMTANTIPVINNQSPPPQQDCSGSGWRHGDDQPSVEETVLQELGSATQQMTEESRQCIRDALYRLASNSEKYSRNRSKNGDRYIPETPLATASPDQTLRLRESEERTNRIDRAVAELMFNKAYLNEKRHQKLEAKPYSADNLRKSLAAHFQHFSGTTAEDAVVPALGKQGESQYF